MRYPFRWLLNPLRRAGSTYPAGEGGPAPSMRRGGPHFQYVAASPATLPMITKNTSTWRFPQAPRYWFRASRPVRPACHSRGGARTPVSSRTPSRFSPAASAAAAASASHSRALAVTASRGADRPRHGSAGQLAAASR